MNERVYVARSLDDVPPEWGQVVRRPAGQPLFHSDILNYWDGIASFTIPGQAGLGWFELTRRPFSGSEVECHRCTPEALLCIHGSALCLAGAPVPRDQLRPDALQAFHLEAGQGIVFAPGTWHAIPFPVSEQADFWVLFQKGTEKNDMSIFDLAEGLGMSFRVGLAKPAVADQ
jgi:hypothetical protein